MTINIRRVTVEEFENFANLPENEDRLFEFIGGEIIEVPSNPYTSEISILIAGALLTFVRKHKLGHVTGEAGGYQVQGERYAPDVAFISNVKQPKLARQGYNPNPPDLAVEVVSPSDRKQKLTIKISNYLAAGTVVWVVYPDTKEIQIHAPRQAVQVLTTDDMLNGGRVLPDFTLAVADIFPDEEE
ncbi:MAG: Uma2 family endonuclease [Anaerolineae bacterium]|nr:Uma2 family endonuclease [Anaerolineae bacterium]